MLTTSSSISPDSRRFTFPVLGKFMVRGSAKMTPIIELVDVLFPLSWSRARGPRNRPVGLEKQSDHLRDSFLKWLNNQDPSPLPVDRNRVLKGVAELQRHDLRNWMMDDRNGFVITGLPGHGKTMLANEIIHEIKNCKCAISSISLCFSSCVPDHSARVAFGALRKFIITIAQSVVKMEQDSIFKNQFAVLEAAADVVGLDKRFAAATAASIGSYLTDGAVKPVKGWVDEISPKDRVDVAISTVVAILQYGCAIGKRYVLIVDDFQVSQ
ncbi:hypothetical protein BC829DRAFT_81687 [Chytridium lagenaria]|nr:hypothetical protein BC829DRAFT_81687 [Chytridium lagenaria]